MLSDLTILDFSRLLPGPYCTWLLAELGATVIKVEDTGRGDYGKQLSPEMYRQLNHRKDIRIVDYKGEGKDEALELIASADALIESFRPGAMAAWGLDYDSLKAINPKLVYCSLTGYGQTGLYADQAGHDINYLALSGVLASMGPVDSPALAGVQIADMAGGSLMAAVGMLAGLLQAKREGKGCYIDAAMLDGSAALQPISMAQVRTTGEETQRGSDMLTGDLPGYHIYACADGHIAFGGLEPQFWLGICNVLERPEWIKLGLGKPADRAAVREAMQALLVQQPLAYWVDKFAAADVCVTPIKNLREALDDPHFKARGVFIELDGKPALGNPLSIRR